MDVGSPGALLVTGRVSIVVCMLLVLAAVDGRLSELLEALMRLP